MRLRTIVIAALLVGAFVLYTNRSHLPLGQNVNPVFYGPSVAHSAGLDADETNNIDVYKSSKNSVVYITSTIYEQDFFFGITREAQGLGSGFLINADGQILTNFHVISGSSDVEVTLPDQSRYKAEILMRDRGNDLALIRIDAKGKKLPFLRLGDSDALQVGQKVLAIGQPFGLSGTLTTGVVSSLDRTIRSEEEQLEGMIQTDAAINSGNSGGPLLDSSGNVIGINTAIYGPNGGSVGIGFALPINRVKSLLGDFRSGLRPAQPRIGVSGLFLSGDWAKALNLPEKGGLLVTDVLRGSPAAAAGIRGSTRRVRVGNYLVDVGGDLIMEVDGMPIDRDNGISRVAARKHAGDTIVLTIYRDGKTMKVNIKLASIDDNGLV